MRRVLIKCFGWAVFVLLLAGFLVWRFPDTILPVVAKVWSSTETAKKADAIVVLGGGDAYRPQEAAALWHAGLAPTVYVFRPEDETMRVLIEERKVPRAVIRVVEASVSSTFDEAVAVGELVEQQRFATILVPTDLFHSNRVARIFGKKVPNRCRVVIPEAPFPHFRPNNWWKTPWGRERFRTELWKTLGYWIRY